MWIEPVIVTQGNKPRLGHYVIHSNDGREIVFQGQAYIKANPAEAASQMREINKYFAWIGQKNPARLTAIFEGFIEARRVLDEIREPQVLTEKLRRAVKSIYTPIVYEELLALCYQPNWVKLPPDMKTQYTNEDTPEKTYLRDDYIALTALSIYVRAMVPIWGEYLIEAGHAYSTALKEDMGMSLMNLTALSEIDAFERLEDYIRAQTGERKQTLAMTIELMASEKVFSWMRAQVLVRRLAIRDLDKAVETTTHNGLVSGSAHLVTLVYSYINTLISDRRFSGPIREKKPRGGGSSEEDTQSVYDAVLVKLRKSPRVINGDVAYIQQFERAAREIEDGVREGLTTELFERISERDNGKLQRLADNQLAVPKPICWGSRVIAQWVMNFRVPARSIPKIPRVNQSQCLAITAAILLTWELPELAALVVGIPINRDETFQVVNPFTQQDTRAIVELYPHALWEDEKTILPMVGLDTVAQFFADHDWDVTAIGSDVMKTLNVDRRGRMSCPPNIRQQLVALTVKLNSHAKLMKGKI